MAQRDGQTGPLCVWEERFIGGQTDKGVFWGEQREEQTCGKASRSSVTVYRWGSGLTGCGVDQERGIPEVIALCGEVLGGFWRVKGSSWQTETHL